MSVKIIDFFKAGPKKPVAYDKSEIESKYNSNPEIAFKEVLPLLEII